MEKGTISVSTENIFPIIKQSLYSDQEIFLRELVSNAIDATQKLSLLSSRGTFEGELGELKVNIELDTENKTLIIKDRGIGMTEEEVKKYLNQVAFSGAEEFLNKFKDVDDLDQIIGRFGLGFYSAFMVADTVDVITKSYQEDAPAIKWTCDGTTSYSIEEVEKSDRGTDIILHISEDAAEFLEEARISNILNKYAKFLPVEITFKGEVINNPNPLWKKTPTDLTDEDYKAFHKELYPFDEEPLFWIHLNVDYPFNLTGVLFFPKIRQDIDPRKNNIQLYSRQVFITDEVKEIVPEYLMLLQGVIDSPDIPLNVSRSYLQSDSNVRKISNYITRKVGDKLNEIFRDDREKFEEKWEDISVFVKYGMLADEKFYDKAEKFCLLTNIEGQHYTIADYKEKITALQTNKDETVVHLYTTDEEQQDMYVQAAVDKGYDVLKMTGVLDNHFIGQLEQKGEKTSWVRVDSDTIEKLIIKSDEETPEGSGLSEEQQDHVKTAFEAILPQDGLQINLQFEAMGAEQLPTVMTKPEFMRRMKDMAANGGGGMGFGMGAFPDSVNLVVNTGHALIQELAGKESLDERQDLAKQLLDLALLSQNMLSGKDLTSFIKRSVDLIKG
ncbi:MAG: molecular chaperone HtpG [Bacteroidota bacterium]